MSEYRILLISMRPLPHQQGDIGGEFMASMTEALTIAATSGTFLAGAASRYIAFRMWRRETARSRQQGMVAELARSLRSGEVPRDMGGLGGSGR